jgi:hypothetical protein
MLLRFEGLPVRTRQTTDRTSNKGVASTIDQIESLS